MCCFFFLPFYQQRNTTTTSDQSELRDRWVQQKTTEDFKPSGISAMYESNFSVAVLPSNVMPPPLPPSPSYTMPPPPPPLHIEMPQLWQERKAADGILSCCCFFPPCSFFLGFGSPTIWGKRLPVHSYCSGCLVSVLRSEKRFLLTGIGK